MALVAILRQVAQGDGGDRSSPGSKPTVAPDPRAHAVLNTVLRQAAQGGSGDPSSPGSNGGAGPRAHARTEQVGARGGSELSFHVGGVGRGPAVVGER